MSAHFEGSEAVPGRFFDLRMTTSGVWLLAVGVLFLSVGVFVSSWTLCWVGQLLLGFLVASRVLVDQSARAVREGRVRVALVLPETRGAVARARPGAAFPADLVVSGLDGSLSVALTLVASKSLSVASDSTSLSDQEGRRLRITPLRAGRWALYGGRLQLSAWPGTFVVESYHPAERIIEVEPGLGVRAPAAAWRRARKVQGAGEQPTRSPGGGSEFRELRDHQPGESFRTIAWKASARRGRLLARDFDDEQDKAVVLLVDCSPSMRVGPMGATPLDRALSISGALLRQLLARGEPAGLVVFDHRVIASVPIGRGRLHLARLRQALLGCVGAQDWDLTGLDPAASRELVADHYRYQEGLEMRSKDGRADPELLALFMRRWQLSEAGRRAGVSPSLDDDALLRCFCRVRGIELPYRPAERGGETLQGLDAACSQLERLRARRWRPLPVLLSDLLEEPSEEHRQRLRRLGRRLGSGVALVPTPAPPPAPPQPWQSAVYALIASEQAVQRRPFARLLGRLGWRVVPMTGAVRPQGAALRAVDSLRVGL